MRKWKILRDFIGVLSMVVVVGIVAVWFLMMQTTLLDQPGFIAFRWTFLIIPLQPYILIGVVIAVGGWLYRACDSRLKSYS